MVPPLQAPLRRRRLQIASWSVFEESGRSALSWKRQQQKSELTFDIFRQEVGNWINNQRLKSVVITEDSDPPNDPWEDYKVVYEVRFLPNSPSQARLEIMLTDDGYFGIGVESRQRIAERLKVSNHRRGFGDGFEPTLTKIHEVLVLLDIVSAGELAVHARVYPWYGLGLTKAATASKREGAAAIFKRFYRTASLQNRFLRHSLTYEPWS